MTRQAQDEKLESIYNEIDEYPGESSVKQTWNKNKFLEE